MRDEQKVLESVYIFLKYHEWFRKVLKSPKRSQKILEWSMHRDLESFLRVLRGYEISKKNFEGSWDLLRFLRIHKAPEMSLKVINISWRLNFDRIRSNKKPDFSPQLSRDDLFQMLSIMAITDAQGCIQIPKLHCKSSKRLSKVKAKNCYITWWCLLLLLLLLRRNFNCEKPFLLSALHK